MSTKVYKLFIDGAFKPSAANKTFDTFNPATEDIIASIAIASAEDVDAAVTAARDAFDNGPWPRMRAVERASILYHIADLLEENQDLFAKLETQDSGLPIMMTKGGHLPRAIAHFRYFAAEAERLTGEAYPLDHAYLNYIVREPIGVIGLFTPWNASLSVTTMNLAAALCSGNTVVIKPSEKTPLTIAVLAEILAETYLPPGVVNIVQGPVDPTGEALVRHPGVDMISFTGGTEAGRKIMANGAETLKRVSLELGGKSANIIFEDAPFEAALDGAILSIFANNGEVCTAGSRILVERSLYQFFLDAFVNRAKHLRVGDPLAPNTEMGPLISKAHRENISSQVQQAIGEGAQLLCGGSPPDALKIGYYYSPTVLSNVQNKMDIAQKELFGPVAVVIPFHSEEEAIAMANNNPYGLAGYVWSNDTKRAMRVSQRLRVGTVAVNSVMVRDIRAPFGGYKQSGIGRTGGRYSVEMFTELKTTCLPIRPYDFPKFGYEH